MIDLCAYKTITKNETAGWYDTSEEIIGISLTSDTPRYEIQNLIKTNRKEVINKEFDETEECVIFVYDRETLKTFKEYNYGEKFKYFLDKCLATNLDTFYIQCF